MLESCPAIEKVNNVYGFTSLILLDCEELYEFSMYLTELTTVRINDCPLVKLFINGSHLEELSLINCGLIFVKNISGHAFVEIKNVRLLPDISSNCILVSKPLRSDDPAFPEATRVNECMNEIFEKVHLIRRFMIKVICRQRYLKLREMQRSNNLYDCVICQDPMSPLDTIFTSCNHVFHCECLRSWVYIRRSCPLCNQTI